jgi:hypothetical protein
LKVWRRALARLGTTKLDQRSAVAQSARRFKADLVRDLGGDPSSTQLALIEVAARTKIMLDAVDDWLLRQPSLAVVKKRSLIPALTQRQQLADGFQRAMLALGLERRAKPVPSLSEYLGAGRPAPVEGGEVAVAEKNPQNPQNPHAAPAAAVDQACR